MRIILLVPGGIDCVALHETCNARVLIKFYLELEWCICSHTEEKSSSIHLELIYRKRLTILQWKWRTFWPRLHSLVHTFKSVVSSNINGVASSCTTCFLQAFNWILKYIFLQRLTWRALPYQNIVTNTHCNANSWNGHRKCGHPAQNDIFHWFGYA